MDDIAGGVADLLFEGNLGGLVSGFSHGLTNSVSKVMSACIDR